MYKIRRGTRVRVSDASLKLTNHVLKKDFLCPRAMKVEDGDLEFNSGGRESRVVKELESDGYMVFQTSRERWPFVVVIRTLVMSRSRLGRVAHWTDMADTRGRTL